MSKKEVTDGSAYDVAGPFSRFFLWWLNGLMFDAMRGKTLQLEDLPPLPTGDRADYHISHVDEKRKKSKGTGAKPSLSQLLIRLYGNSFMAGSMCALGMGVVRIAQNILVGQLLILNVQNSDFKLYLYLIAGGIASLSFVEALFIHQWTISVRCVGLRARTTCAILAYKRILRWNKAQAHQISTGQIINLFGNDMAVFNERIRFLPLVAIAPLELLLNLGVMWWLIGFYAAAGIGFLLVCLCFQVAVGRAFATMRRKANVLTGERIQLTTDVLNGIKLIKMYAWEYPMQNLIKTVRDLEMSYVSRSVALRAVMAGMFNLTGRMSFFCILLPYVLCGNILHPEIIFTMTTFCYVLRAVAGYLFQSGVAVAAETYVSLQRIDAFLNAGDEKQDNGEASKKLGATANVVVKNLMCTWKQNATDDTMGSVSFAAKPGEIIALVGAVGSGKTTLLMALMNELATPNDTVRTRGTIAYVPQESWVFAGTVLENIVFGAPLDEERFTNSINVCALKEDLKNFPEGRETMVGQKGTMLSGGQKARINLARAVYADADIYLLDDPLSAVDAKVGQHLFHECIRKQLKEKIVILATHQVQFLQQVDSIVLLDKGVCTGQGIYKELVNSGVHFPHAASKSTDDDAKTETECVVENANAENENTTILAEIVPPKIISRIRHSIIPDEITQDTLATITTMANSKDFAATGFVSLRVHWEYMTKDSGVFIFLLLLIFMVLFQALGVGVDYWLKYWLEQENDAKSSVAISPYSMGFIYGNSTVAPEASKSNLVYDADGHVSLIENDELGLEARLKYLYGYVGMLSGSLAATIVALAIASLVCRKASFGYHFRLLTSVLRARPHYFDVQPIGNFQNRFSVDIGDIDYNLPMSLFDVLVLLGGCVAPLVLTCVLNYWLIIPAVLLVIFYCKLTVIHLRAGSNLKRLEGIARSPLYSHVTTTMLGLPVVHAMNKEDVMLSTFKDHLDRYSSAVYHCICANCWITSKIQLADSLYVGVVIFVMAAFFEVSSRETIGLVMTLTFMLMPLLWWNIIRIGEAEDQMTAVERMKNFIQLEPEAPLESKPEVKPPDSWPENGTITMDNVQASYPVANKVALDKLTFQIKNGEKVGIVGRTGAGKSSLITTLFRLMEPKGPVVIDGVLVNEIGLHDLRKQLSVIPQEPIMFAGSVRRNLDPFDEHTDEQLIAALDDVSMKMTVCSMVGGLESSVGESGSAFSIGERQLLCIARCILRNNRIICLDEATANIDNRMDELIQATIRRKFGSCTVITVAHRLSTIMDYDRVMVLDKGIIVEFDEPFVLLQKGEESNFYSLVKSSGPKGESALRRIAEDAHNARYGRQ